MREKFLKKITDNDPENQACKQSDMESNLKETLENPITLKCDGCGINLKSKELLDKHKSEKHGQSVICKDCGYETKNEQSMKEHKQSAHMIDQLDGNSEIVKSADKRKKDSDLYLGEDEVNVKVTKEDPAHFKMGNNGYPEIKVIDPGVTPPARVINPELGIGDNLEKTDLWGATWWKYTFFKPETGYYQRRIYQIKPK